MTMVPSSRPAMTRYQVEQIARAKGVQGAAYLVGMRGYYQRTMGDPRRNDIGVYDDAIFVVSPETFASFNANTDPSVHRPNIATLKPGIWLYRKGIHGLSKPVERRYEALVQAAKVTVVRQPDGKKHKVPWDDTGLFGINIHRGAPKSTSSEGCQTIYPTQWESFLALALGEMRRAQQTTLEYLLVEQAG